MNLMPLVKKYLSVLYIDKNLISIYQYKCSG